VRVSAGRSFGAIHAAQAGFSRPHQNTIACRSSEIAFLVHDEPSDVIGARLLDQTFCGIGTLKTCGVEVEIYCQLGALSRVYRWLHKECAPHNCDCQSDKLW
jgi:hypothetical protein